MAVWVRFEAQSSGIIIQARGIAELHLVAHPLCCTLEIHIL